MSSYRSKETNNAEKNAATPSRLDRIWKLEWSLNISCDGWRPARSKEGKVQQTDDSGQARTRSELNEPWLKIFHEKNCVPDLSPAGSKLRSLRFRILIFQNWSESRKEKKTFKFGSTLYRKIVDVLDSSPWRPLTSDVDPHWFYADPDPRQ